MGIVPSTYQVKSVKAGSEGVLTAGDGIKYRLCKNSIDYGICNQLVRVDSASSYCKSCKFTEVIPNVSYEGNRVLWGKMEKAKRRLLFSLAYLGIYPLSKSEDQVKGLAFRFLVDNTENILTGHQDGLITITLAEADDATREKRRQQMGEQYRTLLGHFRHEIGHYYWERMIEDQGRFDEFRNLFGDERVDYQKALSDHYAKGPDTSWKNDYVTHYAAAHPWEDWAETFAHFLHMRDVVETCEAVGLSRQNESTESLEFDEMIKLWLSTSFRINELGRSMGSGDLYPFVLSDKAIGKMRFVHDSIRSFAGGRASL